MKKTGWRKLKGDYMIISINKQFAFVFEKNIIDKKERYDFISLLYNDLRLIEYVDQLIKFNVILNFFINNKLREGTYHINNNFFINAQSEKGKIQLLQLVHSTLKIEINQVDAAIINIYLNRFIQKIDMFG